MKDATEYVGVSVSRDIFEYQLAEETHCLLNDAEFFPRFIAHLSSREAPPHVVCEAAGGMESGLVAALQQATIRVSLVTPGRLGVSAEGLTPAMLVRYGELHGDDLDPAGRVASSARILRSRTPKRERGPWIWMCLRALIGALRGV